MKFDTNSNRDFITELLIDAMYYLTAQQNYENAKSCIKKIKAAENRLHKLQSKFDNITEKYENDFASEYKKLEPICIQMEDAEYEIGAAYGFQIQHIASIHILCSASLEAYINFQGQKLLKGKHWENFEPMTLETKWLFLPRLVGAVGFDPGKNPFQKFSKMIRYRNQLVHYKRKKEKWKSPGIPEFVKKLGLTFECAGDSLSAVKEMILFFCDSFGEEKPYWLKKHFKKLPKGISTNFFNITIAKHHITDNKDYSGL